MPLCWMYEHSTAIDESPDKQDMLKGKRKRRAIPEYVLKHYRKEHPELTQFEEPAAMELRE